MQIAQHLLIRTGQEHAQVVRLVVLALLLQLVQLKPRLVARRVVRAELAHLAVGVAGHVRQDRQPRRLLVETVDRHDREDLVDRPVVGQRLEDAEVGVVDIAELLGQLLQCIGLSLIHI